MVPPPLLPQIMNLVKSSVTPIGKNLMCLHIGVFSVAMLYSSIPVTEEMKKESRTQNPFQYVGHH